MSHGRIKSAVGLAVLAAGGAGLFMGCAADGTPGVWGAKESPAGPSSKADVRLAAQDEALPDLSIVQEDELDMVRRLTEHRASYHRGLIALQEFYRTNGYEAKRRWAELELKGLEKIKAYRYVLEDQVLSSALIASSSIPEADALYEEAMDRCRAAGFELPVEPDRAALREAYVMLLSLVQRFPSSDKVDDAAYCCGAIVEEFFPDRMALAAEWYERAAEWDSACPYPALFRAATLCDYKLGDQERAKALYQRVIQNGDGNRSNVRWAQSRLAELSGEKSGAAKLAKNSVESGEGRDGSGIAADSAATDHAESANVPFGSVLPATPAAERVAAQGGS